MNPEEEEILDVAPVVPLPEVIHWGWWVLLAVLVTAFVGVIIYLLRRKPRVTIDHKKQALERLHALREKAALLDGYQYGVAVSDVVRHYLTKARGLKASRQTSQEFLADLRRQNKADAPTQERLGKFLTMCDMLKYAPAGKATEPNRDLLEEAVKFIREDIV